MAEIPSGIECEAHEEKVLCVPHDMPERDLRLSPE
jgi:hypothetical protein